jgi:hypothetical protein
MFVWQTPKNKTEFNLNVVPCRRLRKVQLDPSLRPSFLRLTTIDCKMTLFTHLLGYGNSLLGYGTLYSAMATLFNFFLVTRRCRSLVDE